MPFKSRAQAGYLFHNNPKLAKEFSKEMSSEDYAKLPYKKKGPDKGSLAEAAAKRRKPPKKDKK
mgnify:CR=1 FL=1